MLIKVPFTIFYAKKIREYLLTLLLEAIFVYNILIPWLNVVPAENV